MEDKGLESVCQSSAASCRVGQGVEKVMKGGGGVKESRDRQESGHVRVCRLAARSLIIIIILQNKAGICRSHLALGLLQLVGKRKLGGLLLQLGELVLVLAHLFQGGLNELALHVGDRDGELVDLQIPEDHLALKEEHLPLESVPLVKVGLADLLEIVDGGGLELGLGATTLGDDAETLLGLPLLLLLQLLSRLLSQEGAQHFLASGVSRVNKTGAPPGMVSEVLPM